jgi:hypothetical protein
MALVVLMAQLAKTYPLRRYMTYIIVVPKSKSEEVEKIPPADRVAHQIAEDYRDRLSYNNESGHRNWKKLV